MSLLRSLCLSLAATCGLSAALLTSVAAQTSPPPPANAAPKESTVHGRVIYEDTRRPLRRVEVSIYDPAAKIRMRNYIAWTDGHGEFQIKNVPAGKYFVDVSAPGIIRAGPYKENQDESFASVTVDGNSKAEVVVRVKRGAAISGRVTYADGDPVIGATIKVLLKKDGTWTAVFVSSGSSDRVVTDDRGVYRVSGLVGGDYIVGAAEQKWGIELAAQDRPDGANYLNRAVLPATYYNGVNSLGGATPLSVQPGNEQKDIDIVLADRALHSISGTVIFKNNSRAVMRARISLKRKDETDGFQADDLEDPVTNTDENGHFNFDEVPDGIYRLTVSPPLWYSPNQDFPTGPELGPSYVSTTMQLNLSGADLSDVSIEVSSGSRISGTVSIEGGRPLPAQLLLNVQTEKTSEGPSTIRVNSDSTFSINGVPAGPAYLRVSTPLENRYYTKSVTVGKTELGRGPLTVKEGEDVNNVSILISPDLALLSGRVLAADGKTAQGGINVVLVPTDAQEMKTNSFLYATTNADGNFRLSGAPGEYVAIIRARGDDPFQSFAEVLRARYPNAPKIVLQPGENPKVDLVSPGSK